MMMEERLIETLETYVLLQMRQRPMVNHNLHELAEKLNTHHQEPNEFSKERKQ